MKLEVATDGACSGNPGPGGWGFCTSDEQVQKYGTEKFTTNQRMELLAVAQALYTLGKIEAYKNLSTLTVITDSRYVVDCLEKKWYVGWEKRAWTTSGKTPVKHKELWQKVIALKKAWEKRGCEVQFVWVKGHQNHTLNVKADALAVKGRDEAKKLP